MAYSAIDRAAAHRADAGHSRAMPAVHATRATNLLLIVDDEPFRRCLLALAAELGLNPRIIDVHVIRLMVALGAGSPVTLERSREREAYWLRRTGGTAAEIITER